MKPTGYKDEILNFELRIEPPGGASLKDLDRMSRNLLNEIQRDIDTDSASLRTEVAPPTSRSATAVTIGVLVLALLPVVVGKFMDLLRSWIERNPVDKITLVVSAGKNNVTVEYNPKSSTPEELDRFVGDALRIAKAKRR